MLKEPTDKLSKRLNPKHTFKSPVRPEQGSLLLGFRKLGFTAMLLTKIRTLTLYGGFASPTGQDFWSLTLTVPHVVMLLHDKHKNHSGT